MYKAPKGNKIMYSKDWSSDRVPEGLRGKGRKESVAQDKPSHSSYRI